MRLAIILAMLSVVSTVAYECVQTYGNAQPGRSTAAIYSCEQKKSININDSDQLFTLRRRNYSLYQKAQSVVEEIGGVPIEAIPSTLKAKYGINDVVVGELGWQTTYPPMIDVQFTLDGILFSGKVPIQGFPGNIRNQGKRQ